MEVIILIWTTTPWTLPANEAVAINPKIDYVFASEDSEKIFLFARDLLTDLNSKLKMNLKPILEIKGSDLEGIKYKHPIKDKICNLIIGGDYINMDYDAMDITS